MIDDAIVLRCASTCLQVVPGLGGSVAEFYSMAGGSRIDWFRPAGKDAIRKGDVLAMAHIPLVPFSGRIRDATLNFSGRKYVLPPNVPWEANALHGNGWQSPWHVVSSSARQVEIEFRHDGSSWPWRYRALQRFELGEADLTISLFLTNESDQKMPAGIGLHPWFPAGPGVRLTARVKKVWNVDKDNLFTDAVPVPPHWDFSEGLEIAGTNLVNGFTGWDGHAVIEWPAVERSMAITASETLAHLVVYTPNAEPYFCIEPVSHSVDAFNLEAQGVPENGTVVLGPGESISGKARFVGTYQP